jgi:ankyrin repeat protein
LRCAFRKIDINAENKEGQTPLSWAAGKGDKKVVKLLLETDVVLECENRYIRTPLLRAAENGHEAVVKLLLDKGAKLNSEHFFFDRPPLSYAAGNRHEAVVRLLLKNRAYVNFEDEDGFTPLLYAAMNGHAAREWR